MDMLEGILSRRSVRDFTDRPVEADALRTILTAGQSGPSCVNAKDWSFLVVRDRDTLGRMADANGHPADCLRKAAVGILVLGDLSRAFQSAPDYWIIDGSIAAQNMMLAAWSLGIGSVFLGTWPQMDRVEAQRKLFRLPETVVPLALLALGYPAQELPPQREERWDNSRIHLEAWESSPSSKQLER